MRLLMLMLLSILVFNGFSQERLVYEGVFKGRKTIGEAEYEYYENEKFERIFDGAFKYGAVRFESGSELNLSIIGNYKENRKHGNWKYSLTLNEPSNNYESLISTVSGEYSCGNFDGEWTFRRSKVINIRGARNRLTGVNEVTEYSKANFSDNKFVGEFIYDNRGFKVEGHFDDDGFFDGVWRITWEDVHKIPHEEIRHYKNGFCHMLVFRDLSTGRIINSFDRSALISTLQTSDITRDTIIHIDGEKYIIRLIDDKMIDKTVYADPENKNYQGIRHIYDAIGFWVCNRDDVQFIHGNYILEIDHGVDDVGFLFEKIIASADQLKDNNEEANKGGIDPLFKTEVDIRDVGGISFSLNGRSAVSLPLPDYDRQVQGIVVVEVSVNRNGEVISAIPGVRGSTTANEYLLNSARRAAERARFNARSDAPVTQRGTITYHFRLE